MNKQRTEKTKWLLLLFVTILLFIVGLYTKIVAINVIVIGMSIYIYKYGNPVLFKEYDEKKKINKKQAMAVQKAAQEAIRTKKIFKTKNSEE